MRGKGPNGPAECIREVSARTGGTVAKSDPNGERPSLKAKGSLSKLGLTARHIRFSPC